MSGGYNNLLKRVTKTYLFFGIFCLLFICLMIFVEINNGKFWTNDFRVYYEATRDFFAGNNPYEKPYGLGSGYFKYPPTTLYFFWATSNLNYFFAQLIHVFILVVSLIGSITILHDSFLKNKLTISFKSSNLLLYFAFVLIVMHVVREFHMGNVNLLLLFFFVLGILGIKNERYFFTALFWSLMVILKPIVILAFIPLVLYKQWKLISYLAGFGLLYFILPVIQKGWNGNIDLWNSWFISVSKHGDYIVSENSLTYLVNYYFGIKSTWLPSIILLVVLISIMVINQFKSMRNAIFLPEWSIVFLAFTPNFFVTDTEHFLLTLPLLILLVRALIEKKNKIHWFIFGLLIIPFSFNMNDLLGDKISDIIDESGMLGLANLGFILMFVVITPKNKSEIQSNDQQAFVKQF